MNELSRSFDEYFEVIPADTPELLKEAYRIRYQSYCLEEHVPDFEAEKYPDGLETDQYDKRSVHSLLRHKHMNSYVGTVRLVLHDPEDPRAQFPVEEFAREYFDNQLVNPDELPRINTAEISRLCVLSNYRIRKGELNSKENNVEKFITRSNDRRTFPHPLLGLMVAIMRMSVKHNITHWYAGMEPELNKRLNMFGLHLIPIGPLLEYHGKRNPYLGHVGEVMNNAYINNRNVWELLTVNGTIWPAPTPEYLDSVNVNKGKSR